jgi:hypothetical protein
MCEDVFVILGRSQEGMASDWKERNTMTTKQMASLTQASAMTGNGIIKIDAFIMLC